MNHPKQMAFSMEDIQQFQLAAQGSTCTMAAMPQLIVTSKIQRNNLAEKFFQV